MSDPKRYFLKISPTISGLRADIYEAENGEFVYYDDYAKLKSEVERLRKAGDVLAYILYDGSRLSETAYFDREVNAWNAAKEVQP